MSEIFYAGGTTTKNISAADLVNDIRTCGRSAFFVEKRDDLAKAIKPHLTSDTAIILMGARDPSLDEFARKFFEEL